MPAGSLNLSYVAWDAREHVDENRRRFLSALQLNPDHLSTLSQIHSSAFHIINGKAGQWNRSLEGDALITQLDQVALAVQVADCFPVLIADPGSGVISAVHAGWRGVLGRILFHTLKGMQRSFRADPAGFVVAIGPGIRSCCLEIGADVAVAFETEFAGARLCTPRSEHEGKYLLDLPRALRQQLQQAGVPPETVFDLGLCTCCHVDEFFSYRGEGVRSGRMMGVICKAAP
jgi:YfiH family protein